VPNPPRHHGVDEVKNVLGDKSDVAKQNVLVELQNIVDQPKNPGVGVHAGHIEGSAKRNTRNQGRNPEFRDVFARNRMG
jgi:hypothetical protein